MRSFWHDESGATAIEYALIATIVSIAAILGIGMIGTTLRDQYYNDIADKFANF